MKPVDLTGSHTPAPPRKDFCQFTLRQRRGPWLAVVLPKCNFNMLAVLSVAEVWVASACCKQKGAADAAYLSCGDFVLRE